MKRETGDDGEGVEADGKDERKQEFASRDEGRKGRGGGGGQGASGSGGKTIHIAHAARRRSRASALHSEATTASPSCRTRVTIELN